MNAEEKKLHDEAMAKAAEANKSRNNERLERMNAIADGSEENRELPHEELEIKDDAAEREARAIAEDEAAAKLLQTEGVESDEKEPKDEKSDSDTKTVNGDLYYRQIVNGSEKWQTLKQIRETAQKVESGDEYLRQAAESVKNASRLALSHKDEPSSVERVDVRKILRAAVLGEEEAIETLASFLETKPSEVTPDVLRTIDQRLSFRTELAELEDKSKDLLENQYTRRLFNDRLSELKAENPTMGLSEAYTSIDNELRTAFPGLLKPKVSKDKLERKRTLVNPPNAAARQQPEEEPEGEEDLSEVIGKMAKARGVTPVVHSRR